MQQPVAGGTNHHEIFRTVGTATCPWHLMMNMQVPGVPTSRQFAPMPRPGHDKTPGCRRYGSGVALIHFADSAVSLCAQQLFSADFQLAPVGLNGGFITFRTMVNMHLNRRSFTRRMFPPGGTIRNKSTHDFQQRLNSIYGNLPVFSYQLPQIFVPGKLSGGHFQSDLNRNNGCRHQGLRYRQQRFLPHFILSRFQSGPFHFPFENPSRVIQSHLQPLILVFLIGDGGQHSGGGVPQLTRFYLGFHLG